LRSANSASSATWFRSKTFIKDPVHGVIHLNNLESELVDSPLFMRLQGIKQLGFTYLVYPQAKHTRFEHSLGSMHAAGIIAETLLKSLEEDLGKELSKKSERQLFVELFRLSALLHDIGHFPYSHATEGVLVRGIREGWVDGKVLADYEYSISKKISLHEAVTCNLIKLLVERYKKRDSFPAALIEASLKVLCDDEVSGSWSELYSDDVIGIVRSVISGRITDIDKIDYLVRDAYNTGAKFGVIDIERLLSSVKLTEVSNQVKLVIPSKLLSNVEDLYYARYMMFKYVYLHHRVLATEACYEKALQLVFKRWEKLRKSFTPLLGRTPSSLGDFFSSTKIFDLAYSKGLLFDDSVVDYLLKVAYRESDASERPWFEAIYLRKKVLRPLFKRETVLRTMYYKNYCSADRSCEDFGEMLKRLYSKYNDSQALESEISGELRGVLGCDLVVKVAPPLSSGEGELPLVDVDGMLESVDKVSPFVFAVERAGEAPTIFVYAKRECKRADALEALVRVLVKLASN